MVGWTYDAAGNLTHDGSTTYAYDALGRLTQRGSTTNSYNGDGVLVAQGSTRYTQDLQAPLSQILSDGTATHIYGRERLASVTGNTRTWYGTDALGSVRQTLSDSGSVASTTSYDPWGQVTQGAVATFGFTGELQQGDAVYLRARWYQPRTGTFLGRDPWSGDPRRPQSLHAFAYVANHPTNATDPSGMREAIDDGGASIAWQLIWVMDDPHRAEESTLWKLAQWFDAHPDVAWRYNPELDPILTAAIKACDRDVDATLNQINQALGYWGMDHDDHGEANLNYVLGAALWLGSGDVGSLGGVGGGGVPANIYDESYVRPGFKGRQHHYDDTINDNLDPHHGGGTSSAQQSVANVVAGGGAQVENIPLGYRERIQRFVDKYNIEVTVVGSRAAGAPNPGDWDYLIGGNSKVRNHAKRELPRGTSGGAMNSVDQETGIDIFNANYETLDTTKPYITFRPRQK